MFQLILTLIQGRVNRTFVEIFFHDYNFFFVSFQRRLCGCLHVRVIYLKSKEKPTSKILLLNCKQNDKTTKPNLNKVRLCLVRLGNVRLGQELLSSGLVRPVQARKGQVSLDLVMFGQVRSGQLRLGQVRVGQGRVGQGRVGQGR